jgi:hypothetical protein
VAQLAGDMQDEFGTPTQSWILAIVAVSGCTTSHDVSDDPTFDQGYMPGQVYQPKAPVAVYKAVGEPNCWLDLNDRVTSSSYPSGTTKTTLPPSSRFRIEGLNHVTVTAPIQGESYVEVVASLVDQPAPCNRLLLGNKLSRWTLGKLNQWPTMIPAPDGSRVTLESK